jgi:hypothetical protein
MPETEKPAARRPLVAWVLVVVLSTLLLLILAGFAAGVFRLQLFKVPIL